MLFAAIRANDIQQLERALLEGASVDSIVHVEAEDGFPASCLAKTVTALMLAIGLGRNHIAQLLLERGADVHARGPWGAPATYFSARFGNAEMIAALVQAGGAVNGAHAHGASPIWIGKSSPPTNVADTPRTPPTPTLHTTLASRPRARCFQRPHGDREGAG